MKILHRLFVSHVALAASLLAAPVENDHLAVAASDGFAGGSHGHGPVAGRLNLDVKHSLDRLASQNEQRLQVAIEALIQQKNELPGDAGVLIREPQMESTVAAERPADPLGRS